MKEFLKELFDYSLDSNQRLIAVFLEHPEQVSEKAVSWMSHILNVQHLWNNRVDKTQEPYGVWQVHSLGALRDIDKINHARSLEILSRFRLEQPVDYVNTQGKAFRNSVQEILFQAVNHSTYHRGQIASDFRTTGLTPLVTDYIAFKR